MRSCPVLVMMRCFGASIPLTRRWVSTRVASDVHTSGLRGRFAGETRHETWRSLCITPSGGMWSVLPSLEQFATRCLEYSCEVSM